MILLDNRVCFWVGGSGGISKVEEGDQRVGVRSSHPLLVQRTTKQQEVP